MPDPHRAPSHVTSPHALRDLTRRTFLGRTSLGFGSVALADLLARDGIVSAAAPAGLGASVSDASTDGPLALRAPHFAPRAKHVIYIHLVGAPSHLDLFDFKPVLQQHDGKPCPAELLAGQRFAFLGKDPKLMGSPFKFARHGECGVEISELLPNLAKQADDVCWVRSLHTEEFNHGPAQVFMLTGFGRQGRPSLGAWLTYGLGSEAEDLPAFVVLVTGTTPGGGTSLWGSGFLPSVHQGVQFRGSGEPILFVNDPAGVDRAARGRIVDDVNRLNALRLEAVGDPEIATRIASYELAFRMQTSVPGLTDLSQEPKHVLEAYGTRAGQPGFATNCLLARRLIERGVRVVQLFDQGWDHHGGLLKGLPQKCREVDKPVAALLADLKQRGLLDETLVVWGAEFGRTPMLQGAPSGGGRDHHKDAFALWLAGGGACGGSIVGRTDELGYHVAEDPVHVNDLHATILHLMGLDHLRLTYRYQGRSYRLTDVAGRVVDKMLA